MPKRQSLTMIFYAEIELVFLGMQLSTGTYLVDLIIKSLVISTSMITGTHSHYFVDL